MGNVQSVRRRASESKSKGKSKIVNLKAEDISCLIVERKWDVLKRILKSINNVLVSSSNSSRSNDDDSLVHIACRFNPPNHIVKALCQTQPDAVCHANKKGWYPLHVASRYGANPDVIEYLINQNPEATKETDKDGRIPLHLTAKHYVSEYDSYNNEKAQESKRSCCGDAANVTTTTTLMTGEEATIKVVEMLCAVAPTVVNTVDIDGISPLEYSIENDSPLKAVRKIQKTCEISWKLGCSMKKLQHKSISEPALMNNNVKQDPNEDAAMALSFSMAFEQQKDMLIPRRKTKSQRSIGAEEQRDLLTPNRRRKMKTTRSTSLRAVSA